MSDIPSFPYSILCGELTVRSIANFTRHDGEAFFDMAAKVGIKIHVETFLNKAGAALDSLRMGRVQGAAVLVMN
jgi:propanol-preferring alcohol dehydrogenase